jgi:hypothetical protein
MMGIALGLSIHCRTSKLMHIFTCTSSRLRQAALLNSQLLVSPNNLREARRIHMRNTYIARVQLSFLRGSRASLTGPSHRPKIEITVPHAATMSLTLGTNQVRELSLANFYVNEVGLCHRQHTTASTTQR